MCNQNSQYLCFADHDIPSNSTLGWKESRQVGTNGDGSSIEFTSSNKKTRGTYKKRKTTPCKSIRTEETSLANIENTAIRKEQESSDITTSSRIVTDVLAAEGLKSSTDITMPLSDMTKACTTLKTSILHIFSRKPAIRSFKTGSKNQHLDIHTNTKRLLDRRRQVIMGGRVHASRHQDHPQRFTLKRKPFKNFTRKYSPIILQSIFQQVIDLRKVQTTPNMNKANNFTKRTSTNKYEASLLEGLEEYDDVLYEERHYNETRRKAKEEEQIEMKLREASLQQSYVYQFIVTKVTTESWEKDLPKSSRAIDEEFLDVYEGKINLRILLKRKEI